MTPRSAIVRHGGQRVTLSALLIAALALGACGSSEEADDRPAVTTSAASTSTAATAPTSTDTTRSGGEFTPSHTLTWGAENDESDQDDPSILDGITMTVTAEIAPLTRSDEVPADFTGLLDACPVDPEADAVVPLRLTTLNTSDGDVTAGLTLISSGGSFHYDKLPSDIAAYSGGGGAPLCTANIAAPDQQGATPPVEFDIGLLGSQASDQRDVLLIAHDYYDPEHPDGQPVTLGALFGAVQPSIRDSSGETIELTQTCYTGPMDYPGIYVPVIGEVSPGLRPRFSYTWEDVAGGRGTPDEIVSRAQSDDFRRERKKYPKCDR